MTTPGELEPLGPADRGVDATREDARLQAVVGRVAERDRASIVWYAATPTTGPNTSSQVTFIVGVMPSSTVGRDQPVVCVAAGGDRRPGVDGLGDPLAHALGGRPA